MAEIERKFLVKEMPRAESAAATIEQGYLALDARAEVRLRRIDGELLLTAKSGHGEVREEVEVEIDPEAFEALWPLTAGRRVGKVRHYVPLGEGLRAEIDVYGGSLDGLRTAEIEFGSLERAERFVPPPWLGAELTGDERYANQTLATVGLPDEAAKREDVSMETALDQAAEAATSDASARHQVAPDRAYRLLSDEGTADGVRRVIFGRLDKAAERLREAGDGDALAEAIHGARKDLKKARAALRLVREEVGEKTFKRENRALRDAARALSASRDAEVKLGTLDSLVEGDDDLPPAATAAWRAALAADRDRIVGEESGGTAAAVEEIAAVAGRASGWKLHADGWKLVAPGLDTAYREGREAFAALGDAPSFEAVHELRKRGKDLWYQLRLLRDAWQPVLEPAAEEVHDFTDRLGDHHDLAVLAVDLAGSPEVDPVHRETLRTLIEARQASLLAAAMASGERVYAEKPKAFDRRMHAYWRAWRDED
ncbi:MAG: CHAD domain-containing protein [Actinobacteria bacterium]|nr:CHAD domain-containing protein [Actinomycetota bacterium]